MKAWVDINNSSIVLFFKSIMNSLQEDEFIVTCRDVFEIVPLLRQNKIPFTIIKDYYGKTKIKKSLSIIIRLFNLYRKIRNYDYSMNFATIYGTIPSKMHGLPIIGFNDNEKSESHKYVFRFLNYLFIPKAIPIENFTKFGVSETNIIQFNGLKEHIYIADYIPNEKFLKKIPFKEFIVLRPEARYANYVLKKHSLVPSLLKLFSKENVNILYFPRYPDDRHYAEKYSNVYIPPTPLNGLDCCNNSIAVLTGSGTFTREAACLGIPAISFYPKNLLTVDQYLIDADKVYHSLDPVDIVQNTLKRKIKKIAPQDYLSIKNNLIKSIKHVINEVVL